MHFWPGNSSLDQISLFYSVFLSTPRSTLPTLFIPLLQDRFFHVSLDKSPSFHSSTLPLPHSITPPRTPTRTNHDFDYTSIEYLCGFRAPTCRTMSQGGDLRWESLGAIKHTSLNYNFSLNLNLTGPFCGFRTPTCRTLPQGGGWAWEALGQS